MPNTVESFLQTFMMALGEVMDIWGALGNTNHGVIGRILWFIFVMIVTILLLNLLIAMMGDTYAKIAEIKNEWMRQVIVEQDQEDEEIDLSGEWLDAASGHDQYEADVMIMI